jgi:hypothetical protein
MAAVVADSSDADDIRQVLLGLTVQREVRLHWVAESTKRRDLIAHAISTLDIAAIVTVGSPMDRSKQERARRCCLERLLFELDQFGVAEIWLESRRAAQDGHDMRLIDSARDKRLVARRTTVNFARPTGDAMLWLPDAVAGAVTAAILGESRWLTAMSEVITRHSVIIR